MELALALRCFHEILIEKHGKLWFNVYADGYILI